MADLAQPGEPCRAIGDLSSTKTNIGTAFVDIYTQTNSDGKSVQIDTNGKTQVRLIVIWDKIGTSTHSVQMLEVGTSNVLISMDVVSGLNTSTLQAYWPLQLIALNSTNCNPKSTTGTDYPIFEAARTYLK
jgi:hypothetical protein